MFNSLRVRLLLTLLAVVGVALATMAIYTSHTTSSEFQRSVTGILRYRNFRLDRKIANIQEYVTRHTGEQDIWPGLQSMMESMASSSKTRFVLADLDGKVYADSSLELVGQMIKIRQSKPFAVYLIEGIPILAFYEPLDIPSPQQIQQGFISSVNQSILIAILVAGLLAVLLTLIFSHSILSPIDALTSAAQKMEHGDLTQRVGVKAKGEVGDLAQAFNAMADGLQRVEQLRRNMVTDVAHELRTPLTNLRGYLEAMQDGVLVPTPENIASVHQEVMLLSHLVDDLQELELIEAGQLRLNKQSIDLDQEVEKAIAVTQQEADAKGIHLNAIIPHDLPLVYGDPERLGQVLRNLLENALAYTPASGNVSVVAHREDGVVEVSVRDTGIGIAPEHLPFVFERFYRADKSRTRTTGGAGLGLAIVKQIIEAQGGHVFIESALESGTKISFTLPISNNMG
ncbi:MAG: ATP-binding protein [Anaerolineales bacterium]|jgi:signal transduction histidine kinase